MVSIPLPSVRSGPDEFRGWLAARCPRCEKIRPFACTETMMTVGISAIDLKRLKTGWRATCDFCGTSFTFGKEEKLEPTLLWGRERSLQELIDRTNPALGQAETPAEPMETELRALLSALADEQAYQAGLPEEKPFAIILGAILGSATTTLGAWGLHHAGVIQSHDVEALVAVGIAPGLAVGTALGVVIHARRKRRRLLRGALRAAVEKHKLDLERLWQVYQQKPEGLGRIYPALDALRNERAAR